MKIFRKIKELKTHLRPLQYSGKQIGFVPTMGYLHRGHLSLIEASVKENDITVISIFVNPTQFGPNEDLASYPRDEKRDIELAEEVGAKVAFIPTPEEMYDNALTTVKVEHLTQQLCGLSRPTHFDGVTTVVTKLFNIVHPDQAYFGEKDAQQAIVIEKMVKDLDMDVTINVCPIVREEDGLAMSSRNVYLSEQERKEATMLRKSLLEAKEQIDGGERDALLIKRNIIDRINNNTSGEVDYVEILNKETLEPIERIEGKTLIAMAVKFSKARLIDNILIE
ncbi:pantothenate synthetase [Balneicella halophila]|uniref:Pantothenate synthetase n=1 Tax=Balneicella halophila TaxID=1537566 RepID=A0A7L4UQH1_BALHA|nr:pantoate--beta-alanine ligase [Balneicella halophila]PVX52016.1 pantothenate synthetase [Balneicella halophila]